MCPQLENLKIFSIQNSAHCILYSIFTNKRIGSELFLFLKKKKSEICFVLEISVVFDFLSDLLLGPGGVESSRISK